MKEIKIPELAESIMEGTIFEWLVKEGERVAKGDPIVELETDKVNVEVHSEYSGVIGEIISGSGTDVKVGDVIGRIDARAVEGSEARSEQGEVVPATVEENKASGSRTQDVIASPATRKRARELNIDLTTVSPSDPLRRIRPADFEGRGNQATDKPKQKAASKPSSQGEFDKPVKRIKMSRRRLTIAKRLVEAQHTAAMLTTFNEVDMTAIIDLRTKRKDKFFAKHGVKLGYTSFFTKAVVSALKEFPYLNAEIQDDEIVLKEFYDIGMAVSAEDGLVVPVIRDADQLDFAGIEQKIASLAVKARANNLALEDLQGGTFTITNGGVFGSMLSTPILNAPQVGILGMHQINKRAMVMKDDSIQVRPMMFVALSYDHRIVDGKDAIRFLVRLKELLEDPIDLLLES